MSIHLHDYSADDNRDSLEEPCNDYRSVRHNLQQPFVGMPEAGGSSALEAALAASTNKPDLPEAPIVPFQSTADKRRLSD